MPVGKDIQLNFTYTPSASEKKLYDLTFPTSTDDNGIRTADYAPMVNITVINNGTTSLKVRRNQQIGFDLVPKGVIFQAKDVSISQFSIENDSTGSGSYTVTLDNKENELAVLKDIRRKNLKFTMG